jgi:hypothetical protein
MKKTQKMKGMMKRLLMQKRLADDEVSIYR